MAGVSGEAPGRESLGCDFGTAPAIVAVVDSGVTEENVCIGASLISSGRRMLL